MPPSFMLLVNVGRWLESSGVEAPLVENETTNKRLTHEDENGGSDDEDEQRIVFSGVKIKTQEAEK